MEQVYLDNAATTPLLPEVMQAVNQAMETYANPSSLHHLGAEAEKMVSAARTEVAALINAQPANIVFTSGGTEANNLAIKGALTRSSRKGRVIASSIEHPSVLAVIRRLEADGWDAVRLPVDSRGQVKLDQLEAALNDSVLLVSIMAVNNEIGTLQPLKKIAELVKTRQPQALLHVDGVQALGKIDLDPGKLGVDMLSLSSHKIHGPKGVGALYMANRDLLQPTMDGGGQEGGLRSGTENLLGIVGFGRAARLARENLQAGYKHVQGLRRQFIQGLEGLPCRVVSPAQAVPHIVSVTFPGFRGEILLQALSGCGVYVSTGAACSGKKGNLSHVAEALGLNEEDTTGLLRFSFSRLNTGAEVDYALAKVRQVLDDLAFVRGRRGR